MRPVLSPLPSSGGQSACSTLPTAPSSRPGPTPRSWWCGISGSRGGLVFWPERQEARKAELVRGRLNAGVFKNTLAKVPGASNLVVDADVNPIVPRQLKILVTTRWLYQPKSVRHELATSLWTLWARIEEPDHPDSARISLITPSGTEVGGSRILGGSLIWVDD